MERPKQTIELIEVEPDHREDTWLAQIEGVTAITSQADYEVAATLHAAGRQLQHGITADWEDARAKSHGAYKAVVAGRNKQLAPVLAGLAMLAPLLSGYERAKREEEEQRKRDEAAKLREAEDAALKEAEALEAEGLHEAASRAMAQPIVAAPSKPVEQPHSDAVIQTKVWGAFKIVDVAAISPDYLRRAMLDTPPEKLASSWFGQAVRRTVKAHKEKAPEVVGGITCEPTYGRRTR